MIKEYRTLPLPHLPPMQQVFSVLIVDYNRKSCKTQILFQKKFLGKPKDNRAGSKQARKF